MKIRKWAKRDEKRIRKGKQARLSAKSEGAKGVKKILQCKGKVRCAR